MENDFTLEELLAEKKRRESGGQAQGQPTQQNDLQSTLQQLKLAGLLPQQQNNGIRQNIGDALVTMSGVTPRQVPRYDEYGGGNDIAKLVAQEAIKSQFEDPTVRQLRQAEIDSLSKPPGEGLIRVGKQVMADPTYVKPKEQAEMDETERVRQSETESIRGTAEKNLQSIQKAKEGSEFFGPLGNLPSIAAPNSLLGFGKYPQRKEWENNINQLLAQKVVDLIAEMKRVSKTGATGFGQLSEKEGAILREASTALSKDLPEEQAMYYLNEMERINQRILNGGGTTQQGVPEQSGVPGQPGQPGALTPEQQAKRERLRQKYGV